MDQEVFEADVLKRVAKLRVALEEHFASTSVTSMRKLNQAKALLTEFDEVTTLLGAHVLAAAMDEAERSELH